VVLGVLSLLGTTPFGLGNNQPALAFVLVALGYIAAFAIAARILWRSKDVPTQSVTPAEPALPGADKDIGHVATASSSISRQGAPSRAFIDTVGCVGAGAGASLGFVAVFILALNGIVNNDIWLVIGPLGGVMIGTLIAELALRSLGSARDTR
jgi:hypothetical protein